MVFLLLILFLYTLVLMSERLLVAATPGDVEHLSERTDRGALRALRLLGELRPVLASLLLLRLLLIVMAGVKLWLWAIQSTKVVDLMDNCAKECQWPFWAPRLLMAVIFAMLLTIVFVLLAKIEERSLAFKDNNRGLVRLSGFIYACHKVFRPLVHIEKEEKRQPSSSPTPAAEASGVHRDDMDEEAQEMALLKSIVRFAGVCIHDVMKPIDEVVGLRLDMTFEEVLSVVRETEFSRFPVFQADQNKVTGLIYVKDLVPYLNRSDDFNWKLLQRPLILQVKAEQHCSELLQSFKKLKMHFALVVDEHGNSTGIVTLEDLLEEVTGDINDEFDEQQTQKDA